MTNGEENGDGGRRSGRESHLYKEGDEGTGREGGKGKINGDLTVCVPES